MFIDLTLCQTGAKQDRTGQNGAKRAGASFNIFLFILPVLSISRLDNPFVLCRHKLLRVFSLYPSIRGVLALVVVVWVKSGDEVGWRSRVTSKSRWDGSEEGWAVRGLDSDNNVYFYWKQMTPALFHLFLTILV